ncbi:hypothetical protein ACA910_002926 [Epithemia clementina (nom. ined.)]
MSTTARVKSFIPTTVPSLGVAVVAAIVAGSSVFLYNNKVTTTTTTTTASFSDTGIDTTSTSVLLVYQLASYWKEWTTMAKTLLEDASQKGRRSWTQTLLPSYNNNEDDDSRRTNTTTTRPKSLHVDFMDRLALQPYLYYLENETEHNATSASSLVNHRPRPPGIPNTLRIITVDLFPQILDHVDPPSSCEWLSSRNYHVADVAPPKKVPVWVMDETQSGKARIRPMPTSTRNQTKSAVKKGSIASSNKAAMAFSKAGRHDHASGHISVEQKAWVQAMYQCVNASTDKVGLEILDASTAHFNPYNLRRSHEYGRYLFETQKDSNENENHDDAKKASSKPTDKQSTKGNKAKTNQKMAKDQDNNHVDDSDFDPDNLVLEAPWYQYAWKEELLLRISGQVGFGAELESVPKPSWWKRVWSTLLWSSDSNNYGTGPLGGRRVYRSTIPPSPPPRQSWMDSLWFGIWGSSDNDIGYWTGDGMDGSLGTPNRASNKPHAVIANGILLQRERQALRWLKAICKQHNVPLFILYDPRQQQQQQQQYKERTQGSTSISPASLAQQQQQQRHQQQQQEDILEDVLRREVLPAVKHRLVRTSLRHSAGTAFAKGRAVGRWEGYIQAWMAKSPSSRQEKSRPPTFLDVGGVDENDDDGEAKDNTNNEEGDAVTDADDWSELEPEELQRQLESKGVLVIQRVTQTKTTTTSIKKKKKQKVSTAIKWTGTDALLTIARRLVRDQEEGRGRRAIDDDENEERELS